MLYNLKSIKGKYLMTKWSDDLDLEASYVLGSSNCTCAAGTHSRHCRHKEMKSIFINQGRVNSEWFYNYDTGKWYHFKELKQEV
jgi:hypothetical protein